ncbi:MAG TPA: hypothetical protein DF383_09255 [Deltaproteobacteria bacterium]|nr:hypothetical protein [Deltaproteobacteria bacterium]
MEFPEAIARYSREHRLSLQDAAQVFLQILVLRHLSESRARFMGGTALVLGYGNPRFSEDVDLSQVSDPIALKPGLVKTAAEIEGWFSCPVKLTPPKKDGRTWRLTLRLGRAESIALHVDSQPYRAYSTQPLILQYPSIPGFVVEAMSLDEIMAEKLMAVAYRRYLGGRDLFDLWFHVLRNSEIDSRFQSIRGYVAKKLRERMLAYSDFHQRLTARLSPSTSLTRAELEWKRYLPSDLQKASIFKEIVTACGRIPGFF